MTPPRLLQRTAFSFTTNADVALVILRVGVSDLPLGLGTLVTPQGFWLVVGSRLKKLEPVELQLLCNLFNNGIMPDEEAIMDDLLGIPPEARRKRN